jgi:hypothetical protein
MYKLQYLNIIIETDDEMRKNELMSIGYELVDEAENSNISNDEKVSQTDDSINETSENEISQDADTSEEQSEDNTDETDEENKAGKKSGKAKK